MAEALNANRLTEEYRDVFRLFDKDDDGSITYIELGEVLSNLGYQFSEDQLRTMITAVDEDGDGTIDFGEFLQLMHAGEVPGSTADELQQAFRVFDIDGDGRITPQELSTIMGKLGIEVNAEIIKAMIDELDEDGDGQIDFNELRALMTQGPPNMDLRQR